MSFHKNQVGNVRLGQPVVSEATFQVPGDLAKQGLRRSVVEQLKEQPYSASDARVGHTLFHVQILQCLILYTPSPEADPAACKAILTMPHLSVS